MLIIIPTIIYVIGHSNNIRKLKTEIDSIKLELNRIDQDLYKLNHPAKFKIGDKVSQGVIRKVYFDPHECIWRYKIDIGIRYPFTDAAEWAITKVD